MTKTERIYGKPLTALYSIFSNLRLEYSKMEGTINVGSHLLIKDFNIKIFLVRDNNALARVINPSKLEAYYSLEWGYKETQEFTKELMLTLIECGYMAYIRNHPLGSNGRIYQALLVNQNWGRQIINKRLEAWSKRPDREYLYKSTKEITDMFSILEIIGRYPGFFDFLY